MKVIADGGSRNVLESRLGLRIGSGSQHDAMEAEQAFRVSGEPGKEASELSPLAVRQQRF